MTYHASKSSIRVGKSDVCSSLPAQEDGSDLDGIQKNVVQKHVLVSHLLNYVGYLG